MITRAWARLLRKLFTINKYGYVWIIIAIGLLTFWHIPWIFDYAELNAPVHIAQHISFILVGAMAFLAAGSLGESFTLLALFALIMGFAGLILLDRPIYLVYTVDLLRNYYTQYRISPDQWRI